MSQKKVCAYRKTAEYPNVYSVIELREKAKLKKIPGYNSMGKKDLCKKLGMKWIETSNTPKKSTKSQQKISYGDKRCDINKTKNQPNAYTKSELVSIAMKELDIDKATANKMTKIQICQKLNTKKTFVPVVHKQNPIERSKLKLKKHQKDVVEHLKKYRGLVAAFQTGAGKTLTAVTATQSFLDDYPTGQIIIVTPKSLVQNFKKEMVNYGANPEDPRFSFYTFEKFATTFKNKACPKNAMLIIDESHNLRNLDSARTNIAIRCAMNVKKVLLLTATPMYNSVTDLIPLIAMIRGENPKSPKTFDTILNSTYEFNRYFGCAFAFFDAEHDKNFPTFTEVEKEFVMSPKYYNEYHKIETKSNLAYLAFKHPRLFLNGVRQATNAIPNNPKIKYAIDVAERNNKQKKKTLIYSGYKGSGAKQITRKLKEKGIKYVEITGDISDQMREKAKHLFNLPASDKNSVNVMVITSAGGEGLDLKGVADNIMLEGTWNKKKQEQIRGRAVRYKSHAHLPEKDRHVTFTKLVLKKPVVLDKDDKIIRSADEELRDITLEKEARMSVVEEKLRKLDILKVGTRDCKASQEYKPPTTPPKKTKKKSGRKIIEEAKAQSVILPSKEKHICKIWKKANGYTLYDYTTSQVAIEATKSKLTKLKKLEESRKYKMSKIYDDLPFCKIKTSIIVPRRYRTKVFNMLKDL